MDTRSNPRRPIVRTYREWYTTDCLIDCVIYRCPIRNCMALAVEDKFANYWTSPDWTEHGFIWEMGEGMPVEGMTLNSERANPDMPPTTAEMSQVGMSFIDWFNGDREGEPYPHPYSHLITPRWDFSDPAMSEYFVPEMDKYVVIGPWEFTGGVAEYDGLRSQWDAAFEKFYPSHPDAKMSSHEVTIRRARSSHLQVVKKLERQDRAKIAHAMGITRLPPRPQRQPREG